MRRWPTSLEDRIAEAILAGIRPPRIYKQILDGSLPGLDQAYPDMQRSSFYVVLGRTKKRLHAGYKPESAGHKPKSGPRVEAANDPTQPGVAARMMDEMRADGGIIEDESGTERWGPGITSAGPYGWVHPDQRPALVERLKAEGVITPDGKWAGRTGPHERRGGLLEPDARQAGERRSAR
jgi:hypothetical protein